MNKYNVRYVNSTMYGKKQTTPEGRIYTPFLTVEETVTEEQLERLKTIPFVHNLEILQ